MRPVAQVPGQAGARRRTRIRPARGPSPFGGPRTYPRDRNSKLAALLAIRVATIAAYAARIGREARHFIFTSRLANVWDDVAATERRPSDEEILNDLIRAFREMKHTRVFRRLPAAVWAFADHDRPHLHLAAVMPPGMTIREVRCAWSAGQSTHPRVIDDGARLGHYFASQRAAGNAKLPSRHRFHGWRAPPAGHFTSIHIGEAPHSSPILLPIHSLGAEGSASHGAPGCAPTCAPRAAAGGDAGSASAAAGAASGDRTRRRVSAGERPQAEGRRTTATVGAEVGLASPPRSSEQSSPTTPGVVADTTSLGVLPGFATFQLTGNEEPT